MRCLMLGMLVGCYHPTPPEGAPCNTSRECPSGLSCSADNRCVVDSSTPDDASASDAAIDACPAAHCEGTSVVGCGPAKICDIGCSIDGAPHCTALVPSNGIMPTLLEGAVSELLGSTYDFDSSNGQIKRMNVTVRASGMGVIAGIGFTVVNGNGVFSAHRFDLPSGGKWSVSGSNPIVLYSATTIVVTGQIDAGGYVVTPGPGGVSGSSGAAGGTCDGVNGQQFATGIGDGGGGAGGATAGGAGGPSQNLTGAAGGPVCPTPTTIPLEGGRAGGAGGVATSVVLGGRGGGGGGAIALVAMDSIAVNTGGAVGAPGGDGESMAGASDGGGGGGGGGAVLIESPKVTISGSLTANGGGGGAPSGGTNGGRGSIHFATPAVGGVYLTASGGSGGVGSAAPSAGQTYADATTKRGGGGGGAVGRVEIKCLTSTRTGTESPTAIATAAVVK